jgi:hypothetical protein
MIQNKYKIALIVLLCLDVLMLVIWLYFPMPNYEGYFTKFLGLQGIAFSSVIGAFIRWKGSKEGKSFEDFFFDTNFLLNAKMGVVVVGIPAFIIWVFFIR